ncbi:hypothetical protein [Sorangium sp. So ce1000]|uniref:hypothetical protein n=1 Tax=Sorangium sp. So ce1000 TaxID=3133325 RepID=UPI003F62149A
MTGCGDDDDTGSGGAGGGGTTSSTSASSSNSSTSAGTGGEGGGNGGAGGEGEVGGAGGGNGGAGGEGGAAEGGGGGGGGAPDIGPGPEESCSGCARLAVPFTAADTGTLFQFDFSPVVDLTGATVTFRVKAQSATGGGVQTYVQNGSAQGWVGVPWAWTAFSTLKDWTELTIDVDKAAAAAAAADPNTKFDKAKVQRIGIKVGAGDTGPWANPTIVYVDSITVTKSSRSSGDGGAGGATGEGGAGGATGEGGAGGTAGASSEGGAGGTAGASGEGGAGGTAGASGEGGAGGTAGASGEGGAGGTSGEGGAGGASGEVVHVIGPFEFTDGLQKFLLGDYQPVPGSRIDHLGE